MPEGMNVEIAHKLGEREEHGKEKRRWEEFVEIVEAIVLALVAIATAWSGYQAARWDGHQAYLYGESSKLRFEADAASTLAGQTLLYDATTFNAWLQAHTAGERELTSLYESRFTTEYKVAFDAWLALDPFENPDAPPGPRYMPEYRNPDQEEADRLNAQASRIFGEGTEARETAERYVRGTVLLATVLFLVALAQRFKLRNVRVGLLVVSGALMLFGIASLVIYPKI